MSGNRKMISLISLLALFAIVTTVFVVSFTFAGSPEEPDSIVTYTRGNVKWNTKAVDGIAQLNIFGEPEEGEEYPLIHPFSRGKYYMRLKNGVSGRIGYSIYFYTENKHNIPLRFNVVMTEDMEVPEEKHYPKELENMQILSAFSGDVKGNNLKNFEIDWHWETETDEADTAIGNQAMLEDLLYRLNVLVVIEDNNSYGNNSWSGGGGGINIGTSSAILLHRSYMVGYPEGDFRPEGDITRAEVAAIYARILADYDEGALVKTSSAFADVIESRWYAKYVAKLDGVGVITGYPDGMFRPQNSITRAEFATMCVRFFEERAGKIKGAKSSKFNDLDDSHWSKEYIDKAVAEGFVSGYEDQSVRPDKPITRAEAVTITNRILNRVPDKNYIDKNQKEFIQFTDLKDNTYWAYYEIFEAVNSHHTRMNHNMTEETWQKTL